MTRSPRGAKLGLVLAAIVFVALLLPFQAASRQPAPRLEPLTVAEAPSLALGGDEPLVVRGFLVNRSDGTLLCQGPRCAGPRLAVRGLRGRAMAGTVLLVGTIHGGRIVPVSVSAPGTFVRL
jgi:hypothetical protein